MESLLLLIILVRGIISLFLLYWILKLILGVLIVISENLQDLREPPPEQDIKIVLDELKDENLIDEIDEGLLEKIVGSRDSEETEKRRIKRDIVLEYLEKKEEIGIEQFDRGIYYDKQDIINFFDRLRDSFGIFEDAEIEVTEIKSFDTAKYSLESLQSQSKNKAVPKFRAEINMSQKHSIEINGKFPGKDLPLKLNKILEKEGENKRIYRVSNWKDSPYRARKTRISVLEPEYLESFGNKVNGMRNRFREKSRF